MPVGLFGQRTVRSIGEGAKLLDQRFAAWRAVIEDSLLRMKENGEVLPSAEPTSLASGVPAAIQGGVLLAKRARSAKPLELAIDKALYFIAQRSPSHRCTTALTTCPHESMHEHMAWPGVLYTDMMIAPN